MLKQSAILAFAAVSALCLHGCCCTCGSNQSPMGGGEHEIPDLPPEPPTTVKESRDKAPAWVEGIDIDAPQSIRTSQLFKSLKDTHPTRELDRSVVICRIHTTGNYDTFLPSDLRTTLTFGDHGPFAINGPEDKATMLASVPLVSMKAGDPIKMVVVDRDATTTEHIDTLEGTFEKMPLTLSSDNADALCRAMPREAIEAEISRSNRDVAKTLEMLPASLKPRPAVKHWGYDKTRIALLKNHVESMAAVVGWADPRIQARIKDVANAEAQWDAIASKSVTEVHKDLPAAGSPIVLKRPEVTLTLDGVGCGQKAMLPYQGKENFFAKGLASEVSCHLRLEVENTGSRPVVLAMILGTIGDMGQIYLVTPKGRHIGLGLLQVIPEGGEPVAQNHTLDPSDRATIVYAPREDIPIAGKGADSARLLFLGEAAGVTWMRLD